MNRADRRRNGHKKPKQEAVPVPLIPLFEVIALIEQLKANAETHESELYVHSLEGSYKHGLVDGAVETCKALLELLGARAPQDPDDGPDSGGITGGGDVE